LESIEQRIAQAAARSGRTRADITLVAVTKKCSALRMREAYAAGVREFGENYVQEFAGKWPDLQDLTGARFHLIGHLQSNKARTAAELFQAVETIDSVKLLQRLEAAAETTGKTLDVLLEIKLSDEESKTGAAPEDVAALVEAVRRCPHLRLLGLMTVPPWSEDPEQSRPYFRRLAEMAREHGLSHLSMGMSNDFEAAIEEGATIVRLGTALFGPRPKPATANQVSTTVDS
jgi:PLP dependent protein